MSTPAVPNQPMIILFKHSPIGKPRAGLFRGTDVPPARKAAAKLGLSIIELTDQAGRGIAAQVPAGRIAAHGEEIMPFIGKNLFAAIQTMARLSQKVGSGHMPPSGAASRIEELRRPVKWDDIRIGDLVLAQESDPADGWWHATVLEVKGDIFKLRWANRERRPFQKHRLTLGLICPNGKEALKPSGKKATSAEHPVYPHTWHAICLDQIVLAKEDGPCQQWWEAKTIKADNDTFTLQWRDHPNLPVIVRPRNCLGLVHPAPKAR